MVKVLITGFPTLGGSGLVATKLGLQLANRGHEVHFLFYKEPFFLQGKDAADNVTFHLITQPDYALFSDIGSPYTIQSASKMIEIIREHGIEIVHTHYAIPHAVSAYIAQQATGTKVINTTHGSDTHTLGEFDSYRPTISHVLKKSDMVTSVSKFLARATESVFDLTPDSVEVIYNFIDSAQFHPSDKSRQKWIIQASNFRPIKQIPFMIETFAGVANDFPDWNLQLVGYGPEYPVCVRKSRELGIRDRVKFLGVRRDLPDLLAQSSVLASTSKTESFGLTIAEAMACGTPVFAPNVGGIPEICADGETGLLYDEGNLDSAVKVLHKMLDNKDERRRFGMNGIKRIKDLFSPDVIVRQYEKVYSKVLE